MIEIDAGTSSVLSRETSQRRTELERRARLLAWGGNAWHLIEFGIAVAAGIAAGSIALIGFGADSLIEAMAGFTVIWLFTGRRLHSETAERRAQQIIALCFFVLAAYVGVESVRDILGGHHPSASWVGIGLAAFTAPTMPLLARAKRNVGVQLDSSATVSDGEPEHDLRLPFRRVVNWSPRQRHRRMVVGRSRGCPRDRGRRSAGGARVLAR